ncbi:hypothetical protein F5I97DRAFT_1827204 [Phlebopus sp. FC_14]|nr:hypothetical protein F5I97DRAFT_1827204 [Phlebopus sp. FC_14]
MAKDLHGNANRRGRVPGGVEGCHFTTGRYDHTESSNVPLQLRTGYLGRRRVPIPSFAGSSQPKTRAYPVWTHPKWQLPQPVGKRRLGYVLDMNSNNTLPHRVAADGRRARDVHVHVRYAGFSIDRGFPNPPNDAFFRVGTVAEGSHTTRAALFHIPRRSPHIPLLAFLCVRFTQLNRANEARAFSSREMRDGEVTSTYGRVSMMTRRDACACVHVYNARSADTSASKAKSRALGKSNTAIDAGCGQGRLKTDNLEGQTRSGNRRIGSLLTTTSWSSEPGRGTVYVGSGPMVKPTPISGDKVLDWAMGRFGHVPFPDKVLSHRWGECLDLTAQTPPGNMLIPRLTKTYSGGKTDFKSGCGGVLDQINLESMCDGGDKDWMESSRVADDGWHRQRMMQTPHCRVIDPP